MQAPGIALALALALTLLGGCHSHPSGSGSPPATASPSSGSDQAGSSAGAAQGSPAAPNPDGATAQGLQIPLRLPVSYPPLAIDYVNASLSTPATADHAPLSQAWEVVANLSNASPFAGTISEQVKIVAGGPVPPLISAWVDASPDDALPWVANQVNQGRYPYLQSLANAPALGRVALRQVKLDNAPPPLAGAVLDLLRNWEPLGPDDAQFVRPLAANADPSTKYRAIGYLLALGQASPDQVEALKTALQSDKNSELSAAAEACRIAQDPQLAAALVSHAAQIPLGAEQASDSNQHDSTALFTSYALSFLPGDEAKLLRTKLLGAADSQVRWQARLGELLHGDSDPWYQAVLKAADDDRGMWLALQPDGVVHRDLINTYLKVAGSKAPDVRLKAALHLNRYGAYASDKELGEILGKLMQDKVEQVGAQAWHSAALIRLPGFGEQAQKTLDDAAAPPSVRLAAAFYELKLAEPAAGGTAAAPAAAGGKS